ncbi:MAG TPA: DUF4407 domain-containing protein [Hyalangium sp.]|nr:DUF4407 domain-containing protein [Hyalangium sp.]
MHQTRPRWRNPLARLVRLDIWGHTLLGDRVAADMAAAYLILGVVFVFEVSAWSLLFNYVFHKGHFAVDGWTLAAIGLGLLWGCGIFAIDKGLITTDLQQPGTKKWWGFAARTLLVLASAFITAQPIEQLVFDASIHERLKEELLREEAVAQVNAVKATEQAAQATEQRSAEDTIPSNIKQRYEEAKAARDAAHQKQEQADREFGNRQYSLGEATSRRKFRQDTLAHLQADPTKQNQVEEALKRYEQSVRDEAIARRDLAAAATDKRVAEEARDAATRELTEASDAYTRQSNAANVAKAAEATRIRAETRPMEKFISDLRRANYGDPVMTPSGEPLRWRRADLIERMLVLDQLTRGKPPRWPPDTDPARKEEAIALLRLPASAKSVADADFSVFWPWLSLLLCAAAIPSLAIIFKFTMSEEMKNYYSVKYQGLAGNPEAALQQMVRRMPSRE